MKHCYVEQDGYCENLIFKKIIILNVSLNLAVEISLNLVSVIKLFFKKAFEEKW